MRIYVSHPFSGKPENKAEVERIVTDLTKKYPEHIFYSPIHAFGFMYNSVSYDRGMELCLDLLSLCDELWVFGDYDKSRGCRREIAYSIANGIECNLKSVLQLKYVTKPKHLLKSRQNTRYKNCIGTITKMKE